MTTYRRNQNNSGSSGPEWGIALIIITALVLITGLPTVLVGLIAWRLVPRERWTWLVWLALALAGGYIVYLLYIHGLERMLIREWRDYYTELLKAGFNIFELPFARLWPETWTVWIRTLPAFGFVAFIQECNAQMQAGGQTASQLAREEQQRLRRIDRRALRARKRAQRPDHVPDQAGESMIVGVAIDDREQE